MRLTARGTAIRRVIRRLRGGSQGYLVQGDDDLFYAAKFVGNPQGTRTLINEWIVGELLQRAGLSVPARRILTLDDNVEGREELYFAVGDKKVRVQGAFHFGSQLPVDPNKTAIYDILPRRLLSKVSNIHEFTAMTVFDKWLGQTDTRQAVFVRERGGNQPVRFRAYFIDNGLCFGGNRWEFQDAALHGRYIDKTVYSMMDLLEHSDRVIASIQQLSGEDLDAAASSVPASWFATGDDAALSHLLGAVKQRRHALPLLIERSTRDLIRMGELLLASHIHAEDLDSGELRRLEVANERLREHSKRSASNSRTLESVHNPRPHPDDLVPCAEPVSCGHFFETNNTHLSFHKDLE